MNQYERLEEFSHGVLPNVPKDQRINPVVMALVPWWPDIRERTNRQVYEDHAGMGLGDAFFTYNGIDPDATHVEKKPAKYEEPIWSQAQKFRDEFVAAIHASKAYDPASNEWFAFRHQAHIARQEFQKLGHDIQAPEGWELNRHWPNKATT